MPIRRAFWVIARLNLRSDPEIDSAMTTAASFADLVIKARSASRATILSPLLSPSRDGRAAAARADTVNG